MTNTRITDPEILEKRYPVVLRQFEIREGSGGLGKWNGGNGIRRVYEFGKDMGMSVVSERRVVRPYGMKGGGDGANGVNFLAKKMENGQPRRWCRVGGRKDFKVHRGDWFVIDTPGGGAWGVEGQDDEAYEAESKGNDKRFLTRFQMEQERSN
jgi:5-oxoprolinase (ATP-hydrolysing)